MITNPIVSIITPFLNAEKYLSETIESVLSQTYPHWELILIDDGSTDQSTVIAKHYAFAFADKIKFLEHNNHSNLGKSTSRNLGIYNSSGDYLVFLDADDVLLPFKLEQQLALLKTVPDIAMVFGVTEYWYTWDPSAKKKDHTPELGLDSNKLYTPPELAIFFLKKPQFTPCLCSFLIRKEIVLRIDAFEETIQDLFEDQVLLYKICLTNNVLAENKCYERYRQHSESTSAIAIQNKDYHPVLPSSSRLIFLEWLKRYIEGLEISNHTLNEIIRKEMRVFQYPYFYSKYLPVKNIIRKLGNRLKTQLNN